jgi:hypothetical protein
MKFNIRLNGRSIRPGDLGRELTRTLETDIRRKMGERVRRASWRRCPTHGRAAQVRTTHDGFTIDACCDQFRQEIVRELGR